jgi:hypothetical protein
MDWSLRKTYALKRRVMVMIRNIIVFALTFCVMLTTGYLNIAVGGTLTCGGQVDTMTAFDDNIVVNTGYVLRNFNNTGTIAIKRIVVYDADGNIRCDYPNIDHFPTTFKSFLSPHQSTNIGSGGNMGTCKNGITPQNGGHIQIAIDWSFSGKSGKKPLSVVGGLVLLNTTDEYMVGLTPFLCGESVK